MGLLYWLSEFGITNFENLKNSKPARCAKNADFILVLALVIYVLL